MKAKYSCDEELFAIVPKDEHSFTSGVELIITFSYGQYPYLQKTYSRINLERYHGKIGQVYEIRDKGCGVGYMMYFFYKNMREMCIELPESFLKRGCELPIENLLEFF